jgi:glycosyltransferase involved in cell wall biosynthesis
LRQKPTDKKSIPFVRVLLLNMIREIIGLGEALEKLENVIIVYDFAHINGGQAKVAIDSALLLADAGLSVTFFAAVGPIDDRLKASGIRVELLDQKDILTEPNRVKAMTRGIWNGEAKKALEKLLAEFDPATTVLHCHGYAKALSPSIGPILSSGNIPSVYTMHEYFLACPNGGFYDFQKNEICTRKSLGVDCLTTNCDVRHPAHKAWRVARQVATWGPGSLPRGLKDIIYISETQRKALAPYMPKDARMHYVPNPIAKSNLPSVRASENNIFLFIGRLNPEKGGLMFAKAARIAGVRAVFVGDGPEENAIREANPDAELVGWQSPDQVQDWIGRARALVFPSLWYECQPLTPMEALVLERPVIGGSWSAGAELIKDGINGILYDDPTPKALAKALQKVSYLSEFDSSETRDFTSTDRHVENLLGIYRSLLATPGGTE